jgi:L-ribulose-5-phosphate 3-epimerase
MKKIFCVLSLALLAILPAGARKKAVVEKDPAGQKITIGTIVYNWKDIDNQFKMLHDDGFTSCQLNYSSGFYNAFAEKVKECSKKYNIKVTTVVGVPGHSYWNFTKGPSTIGLVPTAERELKLATYHKMIDFCKAAGVPAMHSHFGFIPEDCSSDQYKNFIYIMKELANYAKDRGINIYFETGQETPTTLVRAIKDIGTGNLFINCDVANLLLYGKANPTDAIRFFGDLVRDVHAKDGTYPKRDNPYELGDEKPIPEGDVDFPAIIKILKQEGYTGALTIECELNAKSQDYLIKTRKYLQNLLDKKY